MPRTAASPEELLGDDIEPVPPEFMGKEAIRLREKELLFMLFELGSLGLMLPQTITSAISFVLTYPGSFCVHEALAKHFVSRRKIRDKMQMI